MVVAPPSGKRIGFGMGTDPCRLPCASPSSRSALAHGNQNLETAPRRPRPYLLRLLFALVLFAVPAAAAQAVARMPIGFYDDPSFRWTPQTSANLASAEAAHASIIHALVDWATVAPTKPAHPLSGDDPAYRLSDIDTLVASAQRYDLRVLLTISGSPAWANGGKTPNHPPTNLNELTQFAHMLASRYNGSHPGLGAVTLFSIWNEPNLGLFLTPQYRGDKIVSPAEYAKLFLAAYKGIKAGDPVALVAAGETSNRGRQRPSGNPGEDSVAPATFARLLAEVAPRLPFAAWATHPYPSDFIFGPTQKVAFPNVSFSTMTEFGQSLQEWFHRPVPIWITEYAEMTKPQCACGVSYAKQALDARKVLQLAAANPYVQMFIWFILRDSTAQTWSSGIENTSGQKKPAYTAFASAAASIAGKSQLVRPNRTFSVTLAVPFLAYHDPPGTTVAITYTLQSGGTVVASGERSEPTQRDENVTFPVVFRPSAGQIYSINVQVVDKNGQTEQHVIELLPTKPTPPPLTISTSAPLEATAGNLLTVHVSLHEPSAVTGRSSVCLTPPARVGARICTSLPNQQVRHGLLSLTLHIWIKPNAPHGTSKLSISAASGPGRATAKALVHITAASR